MNIILNPLSSNWESILNRPTSNYADLDEIICQIFKEVQTKGDSAITKYTSLFDGVVLENTMVTDPEIYLASNEISSKLKAAINLAKSNIEKFHLAQKSPKIEVETTEGVFCWQEKKTYSENRIIYSWRNCTFIFNCFNVSYSC